MKQWYGRPFVILLLNDHDEICMVHSVTIISVLTPAVDVGD